jgi:hypothetical protein
MMVMLTSMSITMVMSMMLFVFFILLITIISIVLSHFLKCHTHFDEGSKVSSGCAVA